jgi:hypothetical protein
MTEEVERNKSALKSQLNLYVTKDVRNQLFELGDGKPSVGLEKLLTFCGDALTERHPAWVMKLLMEDDNATGESYAYMQDGTVVYKNRPVYLSQVQTEVWYYLKSLEPPQFAKKQKILHDLYVRRPSLFPDWLVGQMVLPDSTLYISYAERYVTAVAHYRSLKHQTEKYEETLLRLEIETLGLELALDPQREEEITKKVEKLLKQARDRCVFYDFEFPEHLPTLRNIVKKIQEELNEAKGKELEEKTKTIRVRLLKDTRYTKDVLDGINYENMNGGE